MTFHEAQQVAHDHHRALAIFEMQVRAIVSSFEAIPATTQEPLVRQIKQCINELDARQAKLVAEEP